MLIADCWGGKTPAEIRATGAGGVMCYLAPDNGSPGSKCATPAQVATYRAAGLVVGLVFEDLASDALGGGHAGVRNGRMAAAQAAARHYPAGCVVFASVDFDAAAVEMHTVRRYLAAFAEQLAPHGWVGGCYGGANTLDACVAAVVLWGWQSTAWSNGRVSSRAALYQDGYRPGFDLSTVCDPAVPLWGMPPVAAPAGPTARVPPGGAAVPPAPTHTPPSREVHPMIGTPVVLGDELVGACVDKDGQLVAFDHAPNTRPYWASTVVAKGLDPSEPPRLAVYDDLAHVFATDTAGRVVWVAKHPGAGWTQPSFV